MRPFLKVDLKRIINNYNEYKKFVKNKTVICVVKANGYGLGAVKIASALNGAGCFDFAVANIEEGIELRQNGIKGNILVLGFTPAKESKTIVEYDLTQTLVDKRHAESFCEPEMKAAIKINVGMNRFGFDAKNVFDCENDIRLFYKKFAITDIYTHFPCADVDKSDTFSRFCVFKNLLSRIKDLDVKRVHCSASAAGVYDFDDLAFTRLGITLYGLSPRPDLTLFKGVKQSCALYGKVCMVRRILAGESAGYGKAFNARKNTDIAIINVGYADGLIKRAANTAEVFIQKKRAKIVAVCMDVCLVDVTGLNVNAGDEAEFYGDNISVKELSAKLGVTDYEIVTRTGNRVQRIYN